MTGRASRKALTIAMLSFLSKVQHAGVGSRGGGQHWHPIKLVLALTLLSAGCSDKAPEPTLVGIETYNASHLKNVFGELPPDATNILMSDSGGLKSLSFEVPSAYQGVDHILDCREDLLKAEVTWPKVSGWPEGTEYRGTSTFHDCEGFSAIKTFGEATQTWRLWSQKPVSLKTVG